MKNLLRRILRFFRRDEPEEPQDPEERDQPPPMGIRILVGGDAGEGD